MRNALPEQLTLNGRRWWVVDGRLVPVIAGGAPDDDDDNGGTGGTGDDDGGSNDDDSGSGGSDDDAATAAARARREAAEYRRKLRDAEAEVERLRASSMSETERAEARANAAEERVAQLVGSVRESNLTTSVSRLGKDFGVVDSTLAAKLIDRSLIEYDDETHKPSDASVKAALRAVVAEHSILTRQGDSDAGRRTSGGTTGVDAMNDWLRGGKRETIKR